MIPLLVARLSPAPEGDILDMGDIEYLAIKDFDGKLRKATGSSQANGVIVSLTANAGKDMYVGVATADTHQDDTVFLNEGAGIALVVNGVVVERKQIMHSNNNQTPAAVFKFSGFVLAGQTISINIDLLDVLNHPIVATLECFEEDTGTSPQIPSI